MKRLKDVILANTDFDFDAFGEAKGRSISDKDRDKLLTDLSDVNKGNTWLVKIAVAMLVLLFLIQVTLILINPKETLLLQGLTGILGLSAAGCIRWLLGIWREKTNTETLVRLSTDLKGDALKTVIMVLARSKNI